MRRRWMILVLCLVMAFSTLPLRVWAAEDKAEQVCRQITGDYKKALSGSGKDTLRGYCGLMSSWQLYLMGINEKLIVRDGNDQYDTYCDLETTTGGYLVKAYPAEKYSLEEALNAISKNGTKDVYNLLVGFHWTNTEAGAYYGHALVINAILDGMVYFTEGYPTAFCPEAGGVNICTIREFAADYDAWTIFEGIIHFCGKEYIDYCTQYPSHLFVQGSQPMQVYSQPCLPGESDFTSRPLRSTVAGERFLVTGLMENDRGTFFYRIHDSGTVGYIPAAQTEVLRFNLEDAQVTDVRLPAVPAAGKDCAIGGSIVSRYSLIRAVCLEVQDDMGQTVFSHWLAKKTGTYDLERDTFDKLADFSRLEEGNYTYLIRGDCQNYYLQDGQLCSRTDSAELLREEFSVGEPSKHTQTVVQPRARKNGWIYEQGTWYYYEGGTPRTGWFCYQGADYYLREDGSVTTGWATINGKARFFSDTGVMRTGWIETAQGTQYLLSNGVAACGWRTIEGERYFFNENGLLQTSLQQTVY